VKREATSERRRKQLVAACLGLGVGLAACGSRSEPAVVQAAGIEIRAATEPESPRVGENELRIEVRDAQGRPVEGAQVEAEIRMAAMGAMPAMGGAARVSDLGAGRYRAEFRIPMGGTWAVAVRAHPPSGAPAAAEGSLTVGVPGLRLAAAGAPSGGAPAPGPHAHAHEPAPEGAAPTAPGAAHAGEFQIAPERLRQIGVRMARAERRTLATPIRAAGRVTYDETALHDVSLKVGGWVGELRVDAVGDRVARGEVLFTLYSPELYSAQQEYLLALRSRERARDTAAPDRADYLLEAARNRLRLWDVAPAELERLARAGEPQEQIAIRSPASGYVVEKNVVAGSAVEPAQRLYRIAPLGRVWVEAEVYEADVPLVTPGMPAEVTLPYLPGRAFPGRVAWLLPGLSEATRTARLRIELENPDEALRPDMLATVALETAPTERLVVPLSSVLHAGPRSFVFLDLGEGRLRPQRVEVGRRVGEELEILAGLDEGQSVVASATFLVASESRLRAALDQW
jgi:Cu(I)/Ag(I) efflux system membrane fusion protein